MTNARKDVGRYLLVKTPLSRDEADYIFRDDPTVYIFLYLQHTFRSSAFDIDDEVGSCMVCWAYSPLPMDISEEKKELLFMF